MILSLTQLWSSVGTPVLGLLEFSPAEQGSSFWCKSACSEAPGAFSAGGGRRRNRSGCGGSPPARLLLLLSFQEVALTQGWLPLILIFVPAGVVTVWHFAKSNSHVCCTCTSADETLTAKLLQTLSRLAERSRAFRLIEETQKMQILRPRCQHLLFITVKHLNMQRNAPKIKVKNWFIFSNTDYLELIIQFIIVRGRARLLLLLSGLNLCRTQFLAATAIDFKKQMWQMLCILGETQPCNYRKSHSPAP